MHALLLASIVSLLPGQQPAVQPQVSGAQQSQPGDRQEPGASAQLQTGTASGLTAEARLQNLLADHQYAQIEAQLGQMPPDQAEFYQGILANRSNDLEQSIKLLEPLVDQVAKSGNAAHEKELRRALAEDFLRLGEWSKADAAYQSLESSLKDKLTADEQDAIEMPLKLLPLVKGNPPTTVEPCDPFKLQVSEDPLGLVDIPVFVDARSRNWMLDPTLPFNLIARSTARDAGLAISSAAATITTLTGRPIHIHATVVPRFTIGGRLTLRNMTAFVYDDKDYYFPQTSYQVEGVLGYPALAAIGSLTINSDNTIFVRPERQIAAPDKDDRLTGGARFYLDGDQVIVALGRASGASGAALPNASAVHDDDRMYSVDAGGQQTYLTSRYFDENAAKFNNQKMEMFTLFGAQSPPQPAYTAENVPLQVGDGTVMLHFIHVLTQPLGSAALDDVYGVLGTDALGQLKSYTFDYRTMRFSATAQ
ncbi:MAG: retropepsin-like aspartic protease [Terracidiphilus sp.]